MLEYRTPPCKRIRKNKIGSGGNGQIFLTDDQNQVCKVLHIDSRITPEKKERRFKRFCQEILVQKELASVIPNILPVYDYSFPEEYSEKKPAWFTMPKAKPFNICNEHSFQKKIEELIELGKIIEKIHCYKKKMAHRDIKPDNILIYENRICLSDYGLVWIDGENSLTQSPERMGPIKIMPPELEFFESINNCDYTKSDVYLFSKVAWMYIKGDKYGFKGPYNRSAHQIYLDKKAYECISLEPFHIMMLSATKDNWEERINITKCIELLQHQLMIVRGRLSCELINKYCLQENISFFDAVIEPDYKSYTDQKKIAALFDSLIPGVEIEFSDGLNRQKIKPKKYKVLAENLMALYIEQPDRKMHRILFNVISVHKSNDRIEFSTEQLDRDDLKKYQKDNDTIISNGNKGKIIVDFYIV